MQPGEVIGPEGSKPEQQEQPATQPLAQSAPAPEVPTQAEQPERPESQWKYNNEVSDAGSPAPAANHETVEWTASEYIAHEKGLSWYVFLGLAVSAFAAVVYLLTDELISSIVIVVMGIAFGAFATRQPQELNYALDNTALHVGNRSYGYGLFKSFTIVDEGAIHSIMLMPLQRFMPPLSVYYAPEDEDKIANALSSYLPYEERKQDMVDRLMRRVRF